MNIITTIDDMRALVRSWRRQEPDAAVALVPTMGYLHAGHMSLVARAREESARVVMSIFVNPLQFGPNEDFERYPRDEARDLALAEEHGVDAVFLPSVQEMYPQQIRTTVRVGEVTERLCGASRPGHFDGVATVVSKLFQIVQPDAAYFGLKDAQQVAVIQTMVRDLNMPVRIVPCPILREADGLAMSSRNVYLSPEHRQASLVLSRALQAVEETAARDASATVGDLKRLLRESIAEEASGSLDYAEWLSYPDLLPLDEGQSLREVRERTAAIAALAVRFGGTRLIDNRIFARLEEVPACSAQ